MLKQNTVEHKAMNQTQNIIESSKTKQKTKQQGRGNLSIQSATELIKIKLRIVRTWQNRHLSVFEQNKNKARVRLLVKSNH